MRARGVAAVVLLFTLTACGGGKTVSPPQSPSIAAPSVAPSSVVSNTPSSPAVPAAKDGENYRACADGTCEVLIRKQAVITLNGDKFTATVAKGTLKFTDAKGYISVSRSGTDASRSGGGSVSGVAGGIAAVSWHDDGRPTHIATLTYAAGDTVIVKLTKS
ncbi:hypothetical protein [Kribbella sp.]|uniref:hypothetical protein n=1 Tax=Kribbella sp. TaxID=1871183 RepID=UPI002D30C517|nr:hypothetical protein [Kribbella sp.]HZX06195.1 hypothetical protein [Kribbella sp.]